MLKLKITRLSKRFGDHCVLDNLCFDVHHGELVSLLGRSGAGKSTLLKIIAGIEPSSDGSVRVLGGPGGKPGRAILVWQDLALFRNMSVLDNVTFGLRFEFLNRNERERRGLDLLNRFGLAEQMRQPIDTLSGGERQRVALARGLAVEPDILLLDEPFSSVDRVVRAQMIQLIRLVQSEFGTTILLVTHDQDEALSVSDRVGILSHGKIVQIGLPNEVALKPACAEVAALAGNWNLWPVRVLKRAGSILVIDLLGKAAPTQVPDWVPSEQLEKAPYVWYTIAGDSVEVGASEEMVLPVRGGSRYEGGQKAGFFASNADLGIVRGVGEVPSKGHFMVSWRHEKSFALPSMSAK